MGEGWSLLTEDGDEISLGRFDGGEDGAREAAEQTLWHNAVELLATTWEHGTLVHPDGERTRLRVAVHPEEPFCADRDGHDWADDGGPWGSGGGVRIRSTCRLCGLSMISDSWATDPYDGSQGHASTEYLRPRDRGYSSSWPEDAQRAYRIARKCAQESVRQAAAECAEDEDQPGGWTGGDPDEWTPEPADMEALADALDREVPLVAVPVVEDAFVEAYCEAAREVADAREAARG